MPNLKFLRSDSTVETEYRARAKYFGTLVLSDHDQYSFQFFTVPDEAKEVWWLDLHIILFCHMGVTHAGGTPATCQAVSEVTEHRRWIENVLAQLPKLKGVTIHAYLCHHTYLFGSRVRVPCEGIIERKVLELTNLPKIKELSLYKYEFSAKPDLTGPRMLMVHWPSQIGAPRAAPPPPAVSDEDEEMTDISGRVADEIGMQ